jgi:hypothetical protein
LRERKRGEGPEGLRENEEARETHGIREMMKEEAVTISGIGIGGDEVGGGRRGGGIVEEIFADEEVVGIDTKRRIDVEGWTA